MHLLAEKKVHINRSAQVVFGYVSNMENFGEWFPGVVSIESLNTLRHGEPGKEYLETVVVPFKRNQQIIVQVCEVKRHHFFATEGQFPPLLPRMEITLDQTAVGSCELTWRIFSRSRNLLIRHLLLPMVRRVMDKRATLGVATLKARMEEDFEPCDQKAKLLHTTGPRCRIDLHE